MKKIIFFDADGTLWYPEKTKRDEHPVWLYKDGRYKNFEQHLVLIPTVLTTLQKLKSLGIQMVILSTSPHTGKKAQDILMKKVNHFSLGEFFDEVHATETVSTSKGEFIEKILKERGLSKKSALMIGDSYKWDYHSAQLKGLDALLIKTKYEKTKVAVKNSIKKLSDILNLL
ncbi:MAG: FMN phosphatase YigB (HAD superfamily) [Candidatus Paceibacteria bacterium]|jgi:FMN phosphatase YigB (HAD superfamily)